jgi:NitT/TauT family transport system substrate-binding protein
MRHPNKFIIIITTVVMLQFILVSCFKQPVPLLRVGTNIWPGFESLYLARSLGYYKNTSIRLVDYPSSSEIIRAYRNGDLEVVALTIDETFLLVETQPNIIIVLVTDISNGADVILGKPEIQSLKDLKGQRVGVESTGLGAFVITRALGQVGLSPKDVQIVSLGVSEHERAFKQGAVDAVVTFEPVRSNLLVAGAKLLFDSTQIPGEIVDVLVVHKELLTSQSNLKALISGWFRAVEYLQQNPQDAARRIAPRAGVTPEQFLKSLEGLCIPDIQENQKLLGKTDSLLLNGARRLSKLMMENKLLHTAVEPAPLLDDRLVKEVMKSRNE